MIVVFVERRHREHMLVAEMPFDVHGDLRREIIRFARIEFRIEEHQFRKIVLRFQFAETGAVTVFPGNFKNPFPRLRADASVSGERPRHRRNRDPRLPRKFLNRNPVSHFSVSLFFAEMYHAE